MPRQLPPVDDDVFEALQALAEPLVDDVNTVLRRLLAAHAAPTSQFEPREVTFLAVEERGARTAAKRSRTRKVVKAKGQRAEKGTCLADTDYELPVLMALQELGGRAPARDVLERLAELLDRRLSPADRETLKSGDVRWKNRAQFARLNLVREGSLAKNSPRGTWEITEQGVERASMAGISQGQPTASEGA